MRRRDFLKRGATGTLAFTLSGLMISSARARAGSQQLQQSMIAVRNLLLSSSPPREAGTYELTADSRITTMIDGTTVFTWGLNDPLSPGPGQIGSGMIVGEGDTVTVRLHNNLDRPINFVIAGVLDDTPAVAPGTSQTYVFEAPAAGTYMYTDGVHGFIGKAMGLFGPLVVLPAARASLYTGGPTFDKQYTMVMSDMDSRLNAAVARGAENYNIADYEPNYYFANGLIYPDTKKYEDTLITMNVGDDVAIRFINAGVIEYPMHFHGYHVQVIKNNQQRITDFVERDTVLVRPDTTAEVILPVVQAGTFPLHTHYVPGVTVNGIYTNPYGGSLLIMVAT